MPKRISAYALASARPEFNCEDPSFKAQEGCFSVGAGRPSAEGFCADWKSASQALRARRRPPPTRTLSRSAHADRRPKAPGGQIRSAQADRRPKALRRLKSASSGADAPGVGLRRREGFSRSAQADRRPKAFAPIGNRPSQALRARRRPRRRKTPSRSAQADRRPKASGGRIHSTDMLPPPALPRPSSRASGALRSPRSSRPKRCRVSAISRSR
jgi:hypothetical protein